jgi:sugar lactone lactonase YvrE
LSGIGGPAASASFDRPSDVVVDAAGNVYFSAETAQQVFRIDAVTQIITSFAGNGTQGYSGDNGPATAASFNRPEGVAIDLQGNLYVEDQDNNLIRKIDTAGIITTVAGNPATINQGTTAFSGDGGPATAANLELCCSGVYAAYDAITVDAAGNLFIGDSGHHVVREVTTDGIIHTVAGNNNLGAGYSGDGGAATSAQLNWPMGVAVDPAGDLYIADFSNDRIRKVDAATQTITTVAGNGQEGSGGDGGPATQVSLNGPQKVVLDGKGNLYVADTKNNLVRKTDVSSPTLTFITPTTVGTTDTTDGTLGVVISDIGNAPLTLPPPSTGTNPNVSTSFSLYSGENEACPDISPSSTAATLGMGSSCALAVNFAPVADGNISGSLVLTDNSLNATSPYATQTITLVGTAVGGALTIAPTSQTFTSTPVGSTSSARTSIITNGTSQAVYISTGSLTDAVDFTQKDNCSGIMAANGGTCTVTFTFTPQSAGTLTSTYSIHDLNHPESPLTVALSGNGTGVTQATLSPSSADFGSVTTGTTSSAQTFTLTDTGTTGLAVDNVTITGANPGDFEITGDSCEANNTSVPTSKPLATGHARASLRAHPQSVLAPGNTCTVTIVFTPASAGPATATLTIVDDAGTQTSALNGNGAAATSPQAVLTPASTNFGSVTEGSSGAAQTFTLSNAGNAPLPITSITVTGTNASSFTISGKSCGNSLNAGASCTITIAFNPSAVGGLSAALSVADSLGTQTSSLSGTSVAPVPADFMIAAKPNAQSTYSGTSVLYSVDLTSTTDDNPFTHTVTLSANGLPSGASVSFSPAGVVPGTTQPATSTMTVEVPALSASRSGMPPGTIPAGASLACLGCAWLLRRRFKGIALCVLVALLAGAATVSLMGCSNSKTGFAVPTSTSTITITGTSGNTVHSTTVTLTVK